MDVITEARLHHQEFTTCLSSLTPQQNITRRINSWSPPSQSFMKINFDGAVASRRELGIRIIARNSNWECLAWRTRCHRFPDDSTMAKAFVALEAARLGHDQGWKHIIIEGDC
ncbi:hypothetical protein Salat_1208600 [Sesamum alatum]|uniref:RNase H type-1 domain-containing protein n=1 Tax=Sesamum alatum TaxID=300844 RepID=A0AAE1YF12_9LAMI|nr:hypothetical protein Salat_1208600 [Sesamum alatum]